MPYLLEDGSGWLAAEDGSALLLEGADSAGLQGTIAATSTIRMRGRLAGVIAATSAATGAVGRLHVASGTIAATSEVRAVNHAVSVADDRDNPAAQLAGTAPLRYAWVTLQVDLGRGLETIPNAQIAAGMAITESLDQIADELTFALVGEQFSPMRNAALGGRQRVVLRLAYGGAGAIFEGVVFDGHLYSARYDGAALQCTALDTAAQWTDATISPDVPAGSGRYRTEIVREWLAAKGVPVGSIDLPDNGGTVQKPASYADVRLFEFAEDYLSPTDAVIWCERGRLHIASVAQLWQRAGVTVGRNMIARPVTIEPPATSATNRATVAAVRYTPEETAGDGSLVPEVTTSVVETTSYYAPQSHDGVGPLPGQMVTSRVTTTTVTMGGIVVWQLVDEEGWLARHGGSRLALDSDGVFLRPGDPGAPGVWPGYRFPDGTLRADPAETFRLVRRTLTVRELDADDRVIREGTFVYAWRMPRKAVFEVTDVGGVPTEVLYQPSGVPYGYVLLEDDGSRYAGPEAWSWVSLNAEPTSPMLHGYEREAWLAGGHNDQADSQTITAHTLNAAGQIETTTETAEEYSRGVELTPNSIGAYVYGTASREYFSLAEDTRNAHQVTVTTTNAALDEERFRRTETTLETGSTPVTVVSEEHGPLPYAQQASAGYESQEISATVSNDLAIALHGTHEAATQNQFCESTAELGTVARAIVRDGAATTITLDMPLEATLHKAQIITPALPEYGADAPMLVWRVTRNLSTFRQQITARRYQAGTV